MDIKSAQKMFGKIYFSTQNYGKSPELIFLSLVKNIGSSTRTTFRDYDVDASKDKIAKIISWYFALCNRYNFDVENLIWSKYPNICPRCLSEICSCDSDNIKEIDAKKLQLTVLENKSLMPVSVNDWQEMFKRIYPCKVYENKVDMLQVKDVIASIYARIFEELAEVAECIALDGYCDHNKKEYLSNELADIFAWINSLCNSLNYYYNSQDFIIGDMIEEYYPNVCNKCREARCVCAKGDLAIELAEKGVIAISHTDKLTKIANASALQILLDRNDSEDSSFFIIFIDIDNFGQFNKDFGQHVGDEVLINVANTMVAVFRENKVKGGVFRKGGEEFVVLCNSITQKSAYFIAESLRRAVESLTLECDETRKITISLGIASSQKEGSSLDVIRLADEHMRGAKQEGKNRIYPMIPDFEEAISGFVTREIY